MAAPAYIYRLTFMEMKIYDILKWRQYYGTRIEDRMDLC